MATTFENHSPSTKWRFRILLAVVGLALLALPAAYLSRVTLAQTESSKPAADQQQAVPTGQISETETEIDVKLVASPTPARTLPEPNIEYFPEPSQRERQITDGLDQKASFEFVETPLIGVAQAIEEKLGGKVEIQLDYRALEDAGVGSDTPLTRNVKDMSVGAALRLLLGDLDLTYLIQDEMILITTQDKAETALITRTYPVGDLVPEFPAAPVPGGTNGGAKGGGMFSVPDRANWLAQMAGRTSKTSRPSAPYRRDYDSLINAITTTVYAATWDDVGGPGSIVPVPVSHALVISQTAEVHGAVLELLRALRSQTRSR